MPYKRVIAIGDSFTRGDELTGCPGEIPNKPFQHSQSTWPALIAESLNCDYECYAIGGSGNHWISWQAAATLKQDALFIINWSWFERFDYVDVDTETDDWAVTHPRHEGKLDHYFYRNLDSDIWNLHRNLQQMHSTISLLKQNNIDFIMTCLDTHYSLTYNVSGYGTWVNAISSLQKQVLPHIVDFEDMSFLEWSKHKGFELGPNGHPLEKAHIEAAKYINTVITKESQNEH